MNYINFFLEKVTLYKDRIAVIFPIIENGQILDEICFQYSQVLDHISSIQHKLNVNIGRGRSIGVMLNNSPYFVSAFLGGLANSSTVVSIDPNQSQEQLQSILDKNHLSGIITSQEYIIKAKDIRVPIFNIEDLLDCEGKVITTCSKAKDEVVIVSYTSGTSGSSKGVMVANENVIYVSNKYKELYGISEQTKILTAIPLWHNFGMFACMTSALISGAGLVLMNNWDPKVALRLIEKYQVNVLPGSPFMYVEMANEEMESYQLSSLQVCDSGGDTIPIEYINRFEKKSSTIITEGYGLTETTSLTHFNISARERKIGSIGKKVEEVECKITDLDGNELTTGEYGLLWLRGPMVTKGYVGLQEETKLKYTPDGWFNTEDVVRVDQDGYYYIAGRLSDVQTIKHNLFPREVYERLFQFKGLKKAHVVKGFSLVANCHYYNLHISLVNEGLYEDFIDFVQRFFKDIIIKDIKFWNEFPVTSTGKIKRQEINR